MAASLDTGDGRRTRVEFDALDYWPDGSIRWALCDTVVDVVAGAPMAALICFGEDAPRTTATLECSQVAATTVVRTGAAEFELRPGGTFPFSASRLSDGAQLLDGIDATLDTGAGEVPAEIVAVAINRVNAYRADLEVTGKWRAGSNAPAVNVTARVEFFAGTGIVRVALTVHNPKRAQHPAGQWGLGDPGSVLVRSLTCKLRAASELAGLRVAPEVGSELGSVPQRFEIYQASPGGALWNGSVHRNRSGDVGLDFSGYRITSTNTRTDGQRATPVVQALIEGGVVAVAVPEFWQESPRSIATDGRTIEIGLFPRQATDPQELQGGEQKTHRFTLALGVDRVSDPALAWSHDPSILGAAPEWVSETRVLPYVLPAEPGSAQQSLIDEALDSRHGFAAKREAAGEYGWRNWGDLPADHESAFQPPDKPFVSHYNNQYDPIAGCAFQFLRSGDVRWWRLMGELARHVRDIDVYHTKEDKSLYSGGLFWHTAHYVDAGTSTHRTYPPGGKFSGGPSAEHNYNAGFMWHYFLTGDPASRTAAVGLGQWVLDIEDGRQTVFRWLAGGATGRATETAGHQGPGRGAGHSILALIVADRLTGNPAYLAKADELIRRTAHPSDNVDARGFGDVEQQWSYTAFLQALGAFVSHTQHRSELAATRAYARAVLLHYARWMCRHETPYLSTPERLEFPTETWAAQDLRKAEVFQWAAVFGPASERDGFLERASYFFNDAIGRLNAMPTHVFTRPTVLALSFGLRQSWFERHGRELDVVSSAPETAFGQPSSFLPQKERAIKRAKMLVVAGGVVTIAALVALAYWWSGI